MTLFQFNTNLSRLKLQFLNIAVKDKRFNTEMKQNKIVIIVI